MLADLVRKVYKQMGKLTEKWKLEKKINSRIEIFNSKWRIYLICSTEYWTQHDKHQWTWKEGYRNFPSETLGEK